MSSKPKGKGPKLARVLADRNRRSQVRKCLRCGCTELRACSCGCEWVAQSDVCSACLTDGEHAIWLELIEDTTATTHPKLVAATNRHWLHFHNYLNATSSERPLPPRLTQRFQAELATLKADRKYPEHKPQYLVVHEGRKQ